ncbi:MAG TPA: RsmD family RNA methyltransferase [Gemmatimonadales bacterium]|jgi:16S rRNA (guanine966-N2)-methyltransferase|nr:RsmD family RNA methyltransferase [Gemmatimonadales bacterium]
MAPVPAGLCPVSPVTGRAGTKRSTDQRLFLRIVAGKFAGRDLTSPNDARVRPTAEHVRDYLLTQLAPDLLNARVLDLFAGSGALGLEAISRGARSADFVEFRPASLHALRANVAALRLRERTRIFKRDAIPFATALRPDSYDITFADPPYTSRLLERVLESWRANRFSRILAVEHARAHQLPGGNHRQAFEDSTITIYHL